MVEGPYFMFGHLDPWGQGCCPEKAFLAVRCSQCLRRRTGSHWQPSPHKTGAFDDLRLQISILETPSMQNLEVLGSKY